MEQSEVTEIGGQHMLNLTEKSPIEPAIQTKDDLECLSDSENINELNAFDSAVAASDSDDNVIEDNKDKDNLKLLAKLDQQTKIIETQKCELNNYEKECVELSRSKLHLQHQLEQVEKQKSSAIKEKESMVMRYAVSEKNVIDIKQGKNSSEKKCKELKKECELLQNKVKVMDSEKSRICSMLDNKFYELKSTTQDNDRLKADLNALETKLKWSQNSLKTEIELRKESVSKIELLNSKAQEYMDIAEKAKKDALEAIKEFQTSQDNRAYVLEQECKEQQARLILVRHERDDREHQRRDTATELERVQKMHESALQENNSLSLRILQIESQRVEVEQKYSELRIWADQQKETQADVNACTMRLEEINSQLKSAQDQLIQATEQISLLKERNADIEMEIGSCRHREAELLEFTQQLTEKNVKLQSEFTSMDIRIQQLTCEQLVYKRNSKEHEAKAAVLASELMEERSRYAHDVKQLNKALEEKIGVCEKLAQEVSDQLGENSVMKRKFDLSVREVNKELAQCRKRIEQYESAGLASSSSSSTSLNAMERISNGEHMDHENSVEQVKVVQPERAVDRQALIEHIVKLQRVSARKSEKLDFLEEHVNTLVAELQQKTRLLQSYILREQAGTLSSDKMDNNKAVLAKHGGVMASMYAARISDPTITLELSLDINRKLQAVLEDVLLKNIMFKENVDTLGKEIDRLNSILDFK